MSITANLITPVSSTVINSNGVIVVEIKYERNNTTYTIRMSVGDLFTIQFTESVQPYEVKTKTGRIADIIGTTNCGIVLDSSTLYHGARDLIKLENIISVTVVEEVSA